MDSSSVFLVVILIQIVLLIIILKVEKNKKKITLINSNGVTKTVRTGYNWLLFLFGYIYLIIKGDFVWALISFIAPFVPIFLAFGYNKRELETLTTKGWSIMD